MPKFRTTETIKRNTNPEENPHIFIFDKGGMQGNKYKQVYSDFIFSNL